MVSTDTAMIGLAAAGVLAAVGTGLSSDRDRLSPLPVLVPSVASAIAATLSLYLFAVWSLCEGLIAIGCWPAKEGMRADVGTILSLAALTAAAGVIAAVAGIATAPSRRSWPRKPARPIDDVEALRPRRRRALVEGGVCFLPELVWRVSPCEPGFRLNLVPILAMLALCICFLPGAVLARFLAVCVWDATGGGATDVGEASRA